MSVRWGFFVTGCMDFKGYKRGKGGKGFLVRFIVLGISDDDFNHLSAHFNVKTTKKAKCANSFLFLRALRPFAALRLKLCRDNFMKQAEVGRYPRGQKVLRQRNHRHRHLFCGG